MKNRNKQKKLAIDLTVTDAQTNNKVIYRKICFNCIVTYLLRTILCHHTYKVTLLTNFMTIMANMTIIGASNGSFYYFCQILAGFSLYSNGSSTYVSVGEGGGALLKYSCYMFDYAQKTGPPCW